MTRVTFGVAASSYVAVQTLQQTAHDFGHLFPEAKNHVLSSFYVDDCLAGADSTQEAMKLHSQLRDLLLKGGFDLKKWRSSSSDVMNHIDTSLHDPSELTPLTEDSSTHQKTLGMVWNSKADLLYVSIGDSKQFASTKCGVISDIARTFDILGWICPSTILMKVLFQSLWELKLDWDEEIPAELQSKYARWKKQLALFKDRPFPRCYFRSSSAKLHVQLHGFSDASEVAYSAVVYVSATYDDGPPTVTLVSAKSKVAPLKRLSIPHLELCGTYLLAKLLALVRKALDIKLDSVYAWCDSTIVIHWLDGSPRRFKTFVGNHVAKILTLLPASTWNHVPNRHKPSRLCFKGNVSRSSPQT